MRDLLFGYYAEWLRFKYGARLAAARRAAETLDLRAPHKWYPYARAVRRRIVYHAGAFIWLLSVCFAAGFALLRVLLFNTGGCSCYCCCRGWLLLPVLCCRSHLIQRRCLPQQRAPSAPRPRRAPKRPTGPTNSGKTHHALEALAAAERGAYCGPLRLLAMEAYETLNRRGVRCDMVTGQEVLRVPGARHVACTVEMASLTRHADVAVLDEIQVRARACVICGV